MPTQEQILDALKTVKFPGLSRDIVSFGFVKDLKVDGGDVSFTGFGKFSTSNRAARQGVNPRTGERVQIAAARVPKFSAGSALKQAVKS